MTPLHSQPEAEIIAFAERVAWRRARERRRDRAARQLRLAPTAPDVTPTRRNASQRVGSRRSPGWHDKGDDPDAA
jgi:hypothetical protein